MPETTQFRSALHGYNREDVVAFIDRLTREHEDATRRLQERNEQLRAELNEANEALAAAGDNAETEKALSDAQTLIADLRARNAELEEQCQALSAQLEQREEESPDTVPMPIRTTNSRLCSILLFTFLLSIAKRDLRNQPRVCFLYAL